ncbi:MAG: hypothetical protein JWL96_3931, partial [Sphingomonas bacterium]|uniref:right-handed parallel beta-helix repeat-containing protein n=1 Tax=Sphingomonas bacterium TaxID=1895847 RepID=UPI002605FC33
IAVILAVMVGSALLSAPASAQATRTWISGIGGDDVNPCSRTAPCKTFQGAISKTAAGGEINCIDPGGFGAVTITKSIQIICDGVQQAGILVNGGSGIIINAGVNDKVTLSGLYFDGLGLGTNGVQIVQAGTVTVRNSVITGFNGYGVNIAGATSPVNLVLNNMTITNNGSAATASSGGVFVQPAAGVTANVTIANSRIQNNNNVGFRSDTIGIVGSIVNATIDGSVISGTPSGVLAKAPVGSGTIKLIITRSTIDQNGYGIVANGTGATIRVGESVISNNATGLLINASASLASFGTNMLAGNTTDGAFSGAVVPLK